MKGNDALFLVCAFLLNVIILALAHFNPDPVWLNQFHASVGSDGVLWQVQTTFLSVGFAGLAIAAQLFAEAPLAIGASRSRVLDHVRAGWFVGIGLTANALITVQAIWLPSELGTLVGASWLVLTVVTMVISYVSLIGLFGSPSRLDVVIRDSFVKVISTRLGSVSKRYADAWSELEPLFELGLTQTGSATSPSTFRVPTPRAGLIVKRLKPQLVRRALVAMSPQATEEIAGGSGEADERFVAPQVVLNIEPGDRTRIGDNAFRVATSMELSEDIRERVIHLLQQSIEYEPVASVTPDEETDRDIASLKDALGASLRSGSFGTAERALQLLGDVIREVWVAAPESLAASHRASFIRRDWIFRSIGDVEQDLLLSPRACSLFIGEAMTRAIEAPRQGSMEYFEECLRSFTRAWLAILRCGDDQFDHFQSRIVTCVQNLAEFTFVTDDRREDLQARCTWAMVELVKLALDAGRPAAARLAAKELRGLFEFSDRQGDGRSQVRAGQLVLSAWLDYLHTKGDRRDPMDSRLVEIVATQGAWPEIVAARAIAERGGAPFSRWDFWEVETFGSGSVGVLELSQFIDRAEVAALASSFGILPPIADQETASRYERLLRILDEGVRDLTVKEKRLHQMLTAETANWSKTEAGRLAEEPVSDAKIGELRISLREALDSRERLAAYIPLVDEEPQEAQEQLPILGMNFRVPRHYLVEKIFDQTYADVTQLGDVIARGFVDGEDHRVVECLRALKPHLIVPTAEAIAAAIADLGDASTHFILLTPFGGLEDLTDWYSKEFQDSLKAVRHVESGVLDDEAWLFDQRNSVLSYRVPERKEGLYPVDGTSIALGVFEDVDGGDEPEVRIETGEHFVVFRGESPDVRRFARPPMDVVGGTEIVDVS